MLTHKLLSIIHSQTRLKIYRGRLMKPLTLFGMSHPIIVHQLGTGPDQARRRHFTPLLKLLSKIEGFEEAFDALDGEGRRSAADEVTALWFGWAGSVFLHVDAFVATGTDSYPKNKRLLHTQDIVTRIEICSEFYSEVWFK
jgi:hypothetical protein